MAGRVRLSRVRLNSGGAVVRGLRSGGAAILAVLALSGATKAFVPNERWGATASHPSTPLGKPVMLTWSIVPDGTVVPGEGTSNLISFLDTHIGTSSTSSDLRDRPWFEVLHNSFDRWSQVGGVQFVYEPNDDGVTHGSAEGVLGVRGDLRLSGASIDGISNTLGYSYYPSNSDIVLDTDDVAFLTHPESDYLRLRNILMHEVGHGLGFEHISSSDASFLLEPSVSLAFDGPQLDDIRGLHHLYGDRFERLGSGGNDSFATAAPLGPLLPGEGISVGADAAPDLRVEPGDTDFVSISNTGDRDYFSFTVDKPSAVNVVVTPRGGIFQQGRPGQPQIAYNTDASSNLSLVLFGSSETEVLGIASSEPIGAPESLTNFELPAAGEYVIRVTGSTQVVQLYDLSISLVAQATLLAGDFNNDGSVDAADYTIWRNQLGRSGTGLLADGNSDSRVDAADYDIWKANFGRQLAGSAQFSAPVPEPTGAILAIAVAAAFASSLRPSRRPRLS